MTFKFDIIMLKSVVFFWMTLSALMLRDSTATDLKDSQRLASIALECKISENATESDLSSLKTTPTLKTPAVKCLSTCISEKMGIITNHQLNPEGVMKLLRTSPNISERMKHDLNEIINECKNIRDSDRCEFGSKIMDCINDGGKKRGIKHVL